MEIDIKTRSNWTKYFWWVHSRKAIYDYEAKNWKGSARIVQDDPKADTWNKLYNAKVYAKDSNWNEIQKNWFSTFFPDNWDKKKIMEEVEYAIRNNSGKDLSPWASPNEYKWFTKDWMQINFYLRKSDWAVLSYFPKIISND